MSRNVKSPASNPSIPQSDDASANSAPLLVNIADIQTYDRNPRHSRNPEYDRIKDSIRSQGLDQPLVITQRPGVDNYIVYAGGNTRLLVLKELHEETGEARFAHVPCVFRAWHRESDVLLAHLRENDLRGKLTFIDKAQAMCEARRMIAAELGVDNISQTQLETELRQAGYRIHQGLISRMTYAVEVLLPLIPQALAAGMGKHHIGRIRAVERAARTVWQRYSAEGDSAFNAVFEALCRRYDGPEWDTELLQGAIETEIAEAAEVSVHTVRVALDAELDGREISIPEFVPIKEPPAPSQHTENPLTPPHSELDDEGGALTTATGFSRETDAHAESETVSPDVQEPVTTPIENRDNDPAAEPDDGLLDIGRSNLTDLKSLRGRAWTLAARLAQRNGIGDLVEPVSGQGLGFFLRDVPDPVLADQLDEDALAQVCLLWWQLAACAEMTYAPLESIIPLLPAESVLRRALADEDAELLFSSIWTLDPGHTGYRLWHSLPDGDWQDLIHLMDTYRRIRHLATETGTHIWS